MKILILRTDPSIMNISNYNSQEIGLAKAYVELGHQCDIVYYNGNNKSRIEDIKCNDGSTIHIYWTKAFSIANNGIFPGINSIIKEYDMIQVSEYYQFFSWYVYSKYSKTKKVYVYQGVYDSDNSTRFKVRCKIMDPLILNKKVLRDTQIFTKSNIAKESMQRRGFEKVMTVGVGLDNSRFNESTVTSEWVNKLILTKGNFKYLLYVGVLEDRRNILFILGILKKIVSRNSNIKLVLIGRGGDDYFLKCQRFIEENGLRPYIIYKDRLPQEEMAAVYKSCDLFVFPSKYEIFGMVLLEAMTFGVPIISSYNGGASTIIENEENSIILKDFNEDKWAEKIMAILSDNRLYKRLSNSAKESAQNSFSWNVIARKIIETMQ